MSAVNGAQQLHEDGYIENVSESVYARTVSIIPSGAHYLRAYL